MVKARFGFIIPTHPTYYCPYYDRLNWRDVKEAAVRGEEFGFDSLWITDHLALGGNNETFECWSTLSALASVTQRVTLGSFVTCNSFRPPALLAKIVATVDLISSGRTILGIGAGWHEEEHRMYGYSFPDGRIRVERLREAVMIIRKLWTEERPTYNGKYYHIEEAACEPKPIQKPHPPIFIGARGRKMLGLIAELADGWNITDNPSTESCREMLEILERSCSKVGRDFSEIVKSWHGHIVIGLREAEVEGRIHEIKTLAASKGDGGKGDIWENCIRGTPEQCSESIERYIDMGFTSFMLYFADYPSLGGVKLFAETVLPQFK